MHSALGSCGMEIVLGFGIGSGIRVRPGLGLALVALAPRLEFYFVEVLHRFWYFAHCAFRKSILYPFRSCSVQLSYQKTVADWLSQFVCENTFSHIFCYTFVCELF